MALGFRSPVVDRLPGHLPEQHDNQGKIHELFSPTAKNRDYVEVTVEYSAPPDIARQAIEEAFEGTQCILQDPAPFLYASKITDLGTTLRVFFSFPTYDDWFNAIDEANRVIWNGLRRYGIRPALRRHELGDEFDSPYLAWDQRTVEPRERVMAQLEKALRTPDNFDAEGFEQIVGQLKRLTFNPPSKIAGPAMLARSMLLLVSGSVSLTRYDETDHPIEVQTVEAGGLIDIPTIYEPEHRKTTAWAKTWCVLYVIPRRMVADLVKAYPALHRNLKARHKALSQEQEEQFLEGCRKLRARFHKEERQGLIDGLADKIGALLSGGGALGRLFGKTENKRLLEGAMAATALVAAADGTIEQSERDYVENLFESLDLFKYLDRNKGLDRFEHFIDGITNDGEAGTARALEAVLALAGKPRIADMIVDMCMAVSAADENTDESEVEMLVHICDALSVAPPESLKASGDT